MPTTRTLCVATLLYVAWFPQHSASAGDVRTVGVFIALCDNVYQGIVPVPEAVGKGDDPDHNLYWGCAEGFMGIFGKSPQWKKDAAPEAPSEKVLRTWAGRHASGKMTLTAFAYEGSAIEQCLKDFQATVSQGKYDLVVYLGHNGLMDFYLDGVAPDAARKKTPECMVLCCKSQKYFSKHIACLEATPILLTTQFMYPGAFLLRDVLEEWVKGAGLKAYRTAAGNAYAANQKIPQKAALGVFADLEKATTRDIPPDVVAGENETAAMTPNLTK